MPSPRTPDNPMPRRFNADQDQDEPTDGFSRLTLESDADEPTDSTAPAYARLPDLDQLIGVDGIARENTSEALFGSVNQLDPQPLEDPPTLSDREVQITLRKVVEDSRFETNSNRPAPMRQMQPPQRTSSVTIGLVTMAVVLLLASLFALLS